MTYRHLSLEEATDNLKAGQVVIYPTETFYAIGASVFNPHALAEVSRLKKRPAGSPFPVIIGAMAQLEQIARPTDNPLQLAQQFWPGPLSILFQARDELSPALVDEQGFVAVRMTSHPLAIALCLEIGQPLAASSANVSGFAPAARPDDLDRELVSETSGLLDGDPWPSGGRPSTLAHVPFKGCLHILRQGQISNDDLVRAGWVVSYN